MHPVFHVSLLKPWRTGVWERQQVEETPQIEEIVDDREYEIEKLLRWRYVKVGNRRLREFLILWKGYSVGAVHAGSLEGRSHGLTLRGLLASADPLRGRALSRGR